MIILKSNVFHYYRKSFLITKFPTTFFPHYHVNNLTIIIIYQVLGGNTVVNAELGIVLSTKQETEAATN